MKFTRGPALLKIERILEVLGDGMNKHQVAEAIAIDPHTASRYLQYLLDNNRVHIARYDRVGANWYPVKVYVAGQGENAPKPAPMSKNERYARAWERTKADPEKYLDYLAAKRRRQFKPRPDIASAWMM